LEIEQRDERDNDGSQVALRCLAPVGARIDAGVNSLVAVIIVGLTVTIASADLDWTRGWRGRFD